MAYVDHAFSISDEDIMMDSPHVHQNKPPIREIGLSVALLVFGSLAMVVGILMAYNRVGGDKTHGYPKSKRKWQLPVAKAIRHTEGECPIYASQALSSRTDLCFHLVNMSSIDDILLLSGGNKPLSSSTYLREAEPFLEQYAKRSVENRALIVAAVCLVASEPPNQVEANEEDDTRMRKSLRRSSNALKSGHCESKDHLPGSSNVGKNDNSTKGEEENNFGVSIELFPHL